MNELARTIVSTIHSMPLDGAASVDAQIQAVEKLLHERQRNLFLVLFFLLLIFGPAVMLGIALSTLVSG